MITKKQLGLIFIGLGLLGAAGSFFNDILGRTDFQGIGPMQRLLLLAAGLVVLVGLTLLPLGDRPA